MEQTATQAKPAFFSSQNLPDLLFWILSCALLFLNLGVKGISGSEARWAAIVREMFLSGNFFQPTINFELYFDKPILSYWFIAFCALFNNGIVNELIARIPSALAALATLWATRAIAEHLLGRAIAQTAGWIMLTIYSLAFWGRLAEADMLNTAFSTLAVAWYIRNREKTSFLPYLIFGALCAVGGQTKGLSAIAVPVLVVLVDLVLNHTWKKHLNMRFFEAGIVSILLYFLPFLLVALKNGDTSFDGIYLVFRENITRFFAPFDHKGDWYDYFKYLPQLFLPWTPFLILALAWACRKWKELSADERWLTISIAAIFIMFSLSGSKRVYYILPILPYCAILTALYLCRTETGWLERAKEILLNIYQYVFLIGGCLVLLLPAFWIFAKRFVPFDLPYAVSLLIYGAPLPLGLLLIFLFLYFRKRKQDNAKWNFCPCHGFPGTAVSCAVLLIFVFGLIIPIIDAEFRTGKPFILEAAREMKESGISQGNVAYLSKNYTKLSYYLAFGERIEILAQDFPGKDLEKNLCSYFRNAGNKPVAVIAEYRDWQRIQTPELRKIIQENVFMAEPVRKWEHRNNRREKYVIVALNVPEENRRKITIFQ